MSEWIKIGDAVPPDERNVLICTFDNYVSIGYRKVYKNGVIKWRSYTAGGLRVIYIENDPTFEFNGKIQYWMHLPISPNLKFFNIINKK